MKKVKLVIRQYSINKIAGSSFELLLHEKANAIDVINEVDKMIGDKGRFPIEEYQSLLHMVYNPVKNGFYKQTAITAYTGPRKFLNVKENPEKVLPDETVIILIPEGGCITATEDVLDYERFCKAISERSSIPLRD